MASRGIVDRADDHVIFCNIEHRVTKLSSDVTLNKAVLTVTFFYLTVTVKLQVTLIKAEISLMWLVQSTIFLQYEFFII